MKKRMSKRVFVDNVLLYIRDLTVSTPKLLNLTKTFNNVAEHKVKKTAIYIYEVKHSSSNAEVCMTSSFILALIV